MSCLTNSHKFSVSEKVSGKTRLAGNGLSPYQEAQRSQRLSLARPLGAPKMTGNVVVPLANTTSIHFGARLVAGHFRSSEIMRISQAGH